MTTLEFRRHLHANPELSFREEQTARFISEQLAALGIEQRPVARTGVLACIEGRGDLRRAVVLRADIDALPIRETADVPWRSRNDGVMHACGHDMHAAVLFGVLQRLKSEGGFDGTVFGLFQPGEECNPGGASLVLAENPFEGYDIAAVIGEHVEPQLPVGTFGFRAGKYMASNDELRFTVRGRGGHAAMREKLKDPVVAAAELTVRLTEMNAPERVVSIGRIEADGATNVIPDTVRMEGTMRTFDREVRRELEHAITAAAEAIGGKHGVEIDADIDRGYPCVVNDAALTAAARRLAAERFTAVDLPLRTTAEDFGHYCAVYPSLFYRLGVGGSGATHTSEFRPDESALEYGVEFMNLLTKNILENGKKKKNNITFEERASFLARMFNEAPDKSFTLKHLAAASGGADAEGRNITRAILDRFVEEGTVAVSHRKYHLSRSLMPHYEGTASMTASGAVYVTVEGIEGDVFVNMRNTRRALDGDRVELIITRYSRKGAPEGEIVRIVERSRRTYIGTTEATSKTSMAVHADPRKMPVDIYLSRKQYPGLESGQKVVVRIAEWNDDSRRPTGELVEILGREGENDTEMHAILAEYDLPYRFDEEVERAARRISSRITERDYAERRDMRGATTFTIDPADAKDFDDALSIRRLNADTWEIGVHIADVTHYVRPGSVLDNEAQERGTSVYLVDRTVPMLPERLSNELCSLRPHEEKLCFSAVFDIRENLEITKEWFGRTVIYSDRRFTYAEAQKTIETGKGDFSDEILTLNRLAQGLRKERIGNGALLFDRREAKFTLDADGKPTGVYFKEQKEANHLIEEFMLLANKRVAQFCSKGKGKGQRAMVYRIHDKPDAEKLDKFRSFILRFGLIFKANKGAAIAREMNGLLAQVKGKPEENAVSTLAIRSMSKALYSTDNIGHYGLAFPYYTHFTSPIRRYPDMMVHRLLARYLDGKGSTDKEALEAQCVHASEREIVAAEAERASIKYKMVEFMQERGDEIFDGHISGLTEWGIYVELENSIIEGMVHLRDIAGDFYRFDEQRYEIHGSSTGKTYTLGDKVRVRVKSTDLRRRTLDFELVNGRK